MTQTVTYISHEEMCRRVLHCTIRMHFCLEDPLANHIMCQSLFRVISDLFKKKFENDIVDEYFKINAKPSWFNKKEFYEQFNFNYNKLKHAERDDFGPAKLEYYNFNIITIIICIYGYQEIFEKITIHQIYIIVYQATFIQESLELSVFEADLPNISKIIDALRGARKQNGDEFAWNALSTQFHNQPEIQLEIETDRL